MSLKKNIFFIIFIGFLISSFACFFNLNKFDKVTSKQDHPMIMGDTMLIWIEAEELKRDLYEGKNYFNSGIEYRRTYLPSKILALYSYLAGQDLFENFKKRKINKENGKLTYLIFQSLFYYIALFFFHQKILDLYNYNYQKCFFITGFLAVEPTLLQWHSSFWTESIFFSLLLITLSLIIHKTNNKFFNFFTGIFIGLMYLQKTVAIFFIFPVIFYLVISKRKSCLIPILSLIFGYLIVLSILGYHNFKRSDIFHVTPKQSKDAFYQILVPQVLSKKNNISEFEARSLVEKNERIWIKNNKINSNDFKDSRKLGDYRQKIALKVFLNRFVCKN